MIGTQSVIPWVEEIRDQLIPERALTSVVGEYWSYREAESHTYRVTVYGLGEPHQFAGCLEFRRYVAVVEWDAPAEGGPVKDMDVFRRELRELRYKPAGKVAVRLEHRKAVIMAEPIFHK